jgi:hypothetical protein
MPLIHSVFTAEVAMKLVQNHALARNRDTELLRLGIGVLPCPPHFNQAIFLEAKSEGSPVARGRVNYDSWVCPRDMRLNGKADAGAIPDEWSEIKTQRLLLSGLLRPDGWRKREEQQRCPENKRVEGLLRQFSSSLLQPQPGGGIKAISQELEHLRTKSTTYNGNRRNHATPLIDPAHLPSPSIRG